MVRLNLRTDAYVALLRVVLEQVEIELPVSFESLAAAEGALESLRLRGLAQVERIRPAGGVLNRHFENLCHNDLLLLHLAGKITSRSCDCPPVGRARHLQRIQT